MADQKARHAVPSELAEALGRCRHAFIGIAGFSILINILMLTGPLFMLQVYDRVIPSHSLPTLVGFAILAAGLFAFQGILDTIRGRVLLRIGSSVDADLSRRVYDVVVGLPLKAHGDAHRGLQPMRDLDQIRSYLGSPGPGALFDLPWIPVYVGVCFLFHWLIGLAALAGALILITLTIIAELVSRGPARATVGFAAVRNALLDAHRRNAEVLHVMGMGPQLAARFHAVNSDYLESQRSAADRSSMLSSLSRVTRMVLQSMVLGLGAYLVIVGEATAGIMIASSILLSRALAPVELAIAHWKNFVASRQAHARLSDLMRKMPEDKDPLSLPKPEQVLAVEGVSAAPPGTQRVVLRDVRFELKGGDGLGIIGPSASGKSSLARLIVGAWLPIRGKIRLDGAALDQWSPVALGQHVGYLPQTVELFDGTVAENIARFEPEPDPGVVIAAARAAGVHDLIVNLPEGYETRIGEAGANLSAGQRQRVALARALYHDPFLIVLDEPNSNLDREGEQALTTAILGVRDRGGIAVVIAHRPSALGAVDQVLVLSQGQQQAFGPRDEVLKPPPARPARQGAVPLSVVSAARSAAAP
jgi:ATP-binding cassette, subfamily C, type I secretion system permease/ATPase